jgi:hypothetical protein
MGEEKERLNASSLIAYGYARPSVYFGMSLFQKNTLTWKPAEWRSASQHDGIIPMTKGTWCCTTFFGGMDRMQHLKDVRAS